MHTLKQIIFAFIVLCALVVIASAQTQTTSLTITAAATGERVRVTGPSSIVQLRVEVYSSSGAKLIDQEIRGANVFDWHLQDGQAQRLPVGTYVCVITAKSISGKLTQKFGSVILEDNSVSVQPADATLLSFAQTQAIGPLEENSSWIVPGKDELQTPTVIANDGTDGQMIRGRGALTFRIGNFFTGIDREQMRLTETGNLGVGTSEPQARLDVAGTIRAERFLIARPKPGGGMTTAADTSAANLSDAGVQPLVGGAGTPNQIAKWADNTGLMADSCMSEFAGNIGIGTLTPRQKLEINSDADSAIAFSLKSQRFAQLGVAGADNKFIQGSKTGDSFFRSNEGKNILFSTDAGISAQLYLKNGGNVGINTTNPQDKLDLGDATRGTGLTWGGPAGANRYHNIFSSYSGGALVMASGFKGSTTDDSYLSSYDSPIARAAIRFNPFTGDAPANAGSIQFFTDPTSTNPVDTPVVPTERMRIDSVGRVGVGTTQPTSPLTVAGAIESTSGGFKFPDGTTQTSAAAVGTFVQKAGDTMTGPLTVNSSLATRGVVTAGGGFQFPDGSIQGSAVSGANYVRKIGDTMTGKLTLPTDGLVVGTDQLVLSDGRVSLGTGWPLAGEYRLGVKAQTGDIGLEVTSHGTNPGVQALNEGEGAGVYGIAPGGIGVSGQTNTGTGVMGRAWKEGSTGVSAINISGLALRVETNNGNLVDGYKNLDSGSTVRTFHITNDGTYVTGSDFAEAMPARGERGKYEPGDVLVASNTSPGKVEKASRPYDRGVAGIYSTRPGMLGADKNGTSRVDKDEVPVAIVGIVPTKVSTINGPIRVGDLLTTSSTPGYAMRCANRAKCVGAIVGKALEPLNSGRGVIKMLVMLR